ncbi:MAG TPA: hypothetical protein VGB50_05220 [Flavobacterium sp.]|jgi:hypothetical protein
MKSITVSYGIFIKFTLPKFYGNQLTKNKKPSVKTDGSASIWGNLKQ